MKNQENILKEFRKKCEIYDKNGGFVVYIEDYDNNDFDVELMEKFIKKALKSQEEKFAKVVGEIIGEKMSGAEYSHDVQNMNGYNMNEQNAKEEEKTTGWHYSSDTNSTKFTDCCGIAVTGGQGVCPRCGAKVIY